MPLSIAEPRASKIALAISHVDDRHCKSVFDLACQCLLLDALGEPTVSERFRYAAVEAALTSMFFIDPSSMGAFRGRITNLRRFSVTPAAPKKGSPVDYAFSDVAILAYCLSLFEYGLDPVSVQVFLAVTLDKVLPFLLKYESEDAIFCFYANVMTRELVQNFGSKSIVASTVVPASEANYEGIARAFKPQRLDIAEPYTHFLESRICMMNLSHIRRSLISELKPQESSKNESLAIRRQIEDAMDLIRINKMKS